MQAELSGWRRCRDEAQRASKGRWEPGASLQPPLAGLHLQLPRFGSWAANVNDGSKFVREFKELMDFWDIKQVTRGHAHFAERTIRTLKGPCCAEQAERAGSGTYARHHAGGEPRPLSVEGVFQMVYILPERLLALVHPAFDLVLRRIQSLKRCVQA